MSFIKLFLFVCLILAMHFCSASPSERNEKAHAEEMATALKSGFNSFYQIARFLIHGENMKNNP
jgi:hypothetical protein